METRLTPDAARLLAERLEQWADDAEDGDQTVEEAIEAERKEWYAKGGILAGDKD